MNDINFLLVETIKWKVFLRPLNIVLIVAPMFFLDKINVDFYAYWMLSGIGIFILNINFLKTYKEIGRLIINTQKIELNFKNAKQVSFNLTENIDVYIEYNGYKGAAEDYNILQMPITVKNGIGSIKIVKGDNIYKYKYVALSKSINRLNVVAKIVQSNNGKFIIHT